MSTRKLENPVLNFMVRHTAVRGPMSAEAWNDSVDELSADLAAFSLEIKKLKKITDSIPNGTYDSSIDAFKLGLDGANLFVDSSLDGTATSAYWNGTRPVTVEEAFDDIYVALNDAVRELEEEIISSYVALTTAQKTAIGDKIFNATLTSTPLSLDGKSENNRLNTIQLARDLYGSTYALGNDGAADLTYSVKDQVDALLAIHNGSWNSDITVDHASLSITLAQTSVLPSSTYDDAFVGGPVNLEEDLNQLRTLMRETKGGSSFTEPVPELYTGGASDLEELFLYTKGSGTKAVDNPWGYHLNDIDDLVPSGLLVMQTAAVGSGLPNQLGQANAQSIFEWVVDANGVWDGQKFRRMETGVSGPGPFNVYHGRGAYPQVQLVQIDPSVSVSGQYVYTVDQYDTNNFTLVVPSGVVLVSGVIISLW